MPDVQNVFRCGGAYWWRRTLHWLDGNARPITLALSFGTKDLSVARHRTAAMTAHSEVVRMSLHGRVARNGLTMEQRDAVLRTEMRAYRNALDHLTAAWQSDPQWATVAEVDADLHVYEAIWSAFAKTGIVDGKPSVAYVDKHLSGRSDDQQEAVRGLLGSLNLRDSLSRETAQRLEALGIEPNPTNTALGVRIMLDARAEAVRELRLGIDMVNAAPAHATHAAVAGDSPYAPKVIASADLIHVPDRWRTATPVEAAELLVASNPAMLDHRKENGLPRKSASRRRQHAGIFDLVADAPEAAPLFAAASDLLDGCDARDLVPTATPERLEVNRTAQILCVLLAVALQAALGDALPTRRIVAGYSVGEVAAWTLAGLISGVEALRLAAARAEAMDAASQGEEGLTFVRGLRRSTIDALCENADVAIAIVILPS